MPPINNQSNNRQAVLSIASINVKTLRLDNKQVTQSVFKQIKERPVFRCETIHVYTKVNLEGVPWGIVYYKWADTPKWAGYYLIWQNDVSLYRTALPCLCTSNTYNKKGVKTLWWGCTQCDKTDWGRVRSKNNPELNLYHNKLMNCSICGAKCENFLINIESILSDEFYRWFRDREEWDNSYVKRNGYLPTPEERHEILEQCVSHLKKFEGLDQLFIAT